MFIYRFIFPGKVVYSQDLLFEHEPSSALPLTLDMFIIDINYPVIGKLPELH
jgi:hypothetical protein